MDLNDYRKQGRKIRLYGMSGMVNNLEQINQSLQNIKLMKMHISTWTSPIFAVVGSIVLWYGGWILWTGLMVLALGSLMFHFTGDERNTFWHRLDEWGMYMVVSELFYYTSGEHFLILLPVMAWVLWSWYNLRRLNSFVVIPLWGLAVFVSLIFTADLFSTILALGLGIISWAIRTLPQSDWLHGLWHLLIAATILVAYLAPLGILLEL